MVKHFFIIHLCVTVFTVVRAQTYADMSRLKTNLLTGYDPSIVPMNNQSEALVVSASLMLFNILNIDSVQGVLEIVAALECTWTDEKIVWNPSDYSGLTQVRFLQDTVWTPTLSTTNPTKMESLGEKWMQVRYKSNGSAFWRPANVFESWCSFNVRYWPFDKQTCYIGFYSYNDFVSEVIVQTLASTVNVKYFATNSEWYLEDTSAYSKNYLEITEAIFVLRLQRHSTFYTLTVIMPLVALNLLNSLVFLLPNESADRVGYAMTLLLSVVVFLILIGDHVPKTSDPMPLICVLLVCIVVVSILCLVASILNLAISSRADEVPVNSWGRKIASFGSRCSRHYKPGTSQYENEPSLQKVSNERTKRPLVINKVEHGELGDFQAKARVEPFCIKTKNVSWKDVSDALDRVFFIASLTCTVIPSVTLIVYISTESTY